MKKHILSVILVLLLLTSCTKTNPSFNKRESEVNPSLTDGQKTPDTFDDAKVEEEDLPELRLLVNDGFTRITSNKEHAYFIRTIPEKFHPEYNTGLSHFSYGLAMIFVTDFNKAVTRPLCHIEGCAHNSFDCAAFIPIETFNLQVFAADDKLFWVFPDYGRPLGVRAEDNVAFYTNNPPCIEVSNLDGSDRRNLIAFDEYTFINNTSLFYDGKNIMVIAYDNRVNTPSLIIIDSNTGEILNSIPLCDENRDKKDVHILGVQDNLPVFQETTFSGKPETPPHFISHEFRTFTLDTKTGEQTDCGYFGETYDGVSYVTYDEEKRIFIDVNSKTGNESILCSVPDDTEHIQIWTQRDSHALIYFDYNPIKASVLDVKAKKLSEFTLSYMSSIGEKWPFHIVADTGNDYLIIIDIRQFSITAPYEYYDAVNNFRYVYAMIPKENYWNNISCYTEVALTD